MKVFNCFRRGVIPGHPEKICRVLVCELPARSIHVGNFALDIDPNTFFAYHEADDVTEAEIEQIDQVLDNLLHKKILSLALEQLDICMNLAIRPA